MNYKTNNEINRLTINLKLVTVNSRRSGQFSIALNKSFGIAVGRHFVHRARGG